MGKFQDRMVEEMIVQRFSPSTQEAYLFGMKDFLRFARRSPELLGLEEIRQYKLHLTRDREASVATVNQRVAAIRFFYAKVISVDWEVEKVTYQKRKQSLPVVPNREEVRRLFASAVDLMHLAFLCVLYACGLRLNEARMLRVEDLDSSRMRIRISQGKGRKDREVMLSVRLLKILRDYYRQYHLKPKGLLFPGASPDEPRDATSLQRIFHKARLAARITKRISPHSLRHAFATHALENGMNILVLKELLGHKSLRTTVIYLHLAKDYLQTAISPLDTLDNPAPANPPPRN